MSTKLLILRDVLFFKILTKMNGNCKYKGLTPSSNIRTLVRGRRIGYRVILKLLQTSMQRKMNKSCYIKYWIIMFSCALFVACHDKSSVEQQIYKSYGLLVPIEAAGNVRIVTHTERTLVFVVPEAAIDAILSKGVPGYSNWEKITENESYGNKDIVIDGFVEKSAFRANRNQGKWSQQIIINKAKCTVICTTT